MVALILLPLVSPAVLPHGYEDTPWCPPGSCLEQTRQPDGFTGPQSAFVHCHDPESKVLALGAREVQEIWTGSKVATEPPDGWVVASPCPPYPMPPPPPPSPPGAFVCLLHAGTFFPKVQAFASVRLETDHKNHCLVGGALGGLGSGQSIGDASFPSVPQDAMDETHRKPHSCCWFRGEMLEAEGARRVRVDLWDYDTFSENDYLGGAFFDLGDLAPASARAEPPEDGRPEDDNDEPSDARIGLVERADVARVLVVVHHVLVVALARPRCCPRRPLLHSWAVQSGPRRRGHLGSLALHCQRLL